MANFHKSLYSHLFSSEKFSRNIKFDEELYPVFHFEKF